MFIHLCEAELALRVSRRASPATDMMEAPPSDGPDSSDESDEEKDAPAPTPASEPTARPLSNPIQQQLAADLANIQAEARAKVSMKGGPWKPPRFWGYFRPERQYDKLDGKLVLLPQHFHPWNRKESLLPKAVRDEMFSTGSSK